MRACTCYINDMCQEQLSAQVGSLSIVKKQLLQLGCELWDESPPGQPTSNSNQLDSTVHQTSDADASVVSRIPNNSEIHVWAYTSDAGADQKGMHKLMVAEAAHHATVLVFTFFCFMHQLHLIVRNMLIKIDEHLLRLGLGFLGFINISTPCKFKSA